MGTTQNQSTFKPKALQEKRYLKPSLKPFYSIYSLKELTRSFFFFVNNLQEVHVYVLTNISEILH